MMKVVAVRALDLLTGAYSIIFRADAFERGKTKFVFDVLCFFVAYLFFWCFFEAARESIGLRKRFWSRNGSPWELLKQHRYEK